MSHKIFQFILTLLLWVPSIAMATNPKAADEAVVTVGNARFTVLTPEMLRIEYSDQSIFEDKATFAIVNRQLEVPSFTTREDDKYFYLETEKAKLRYAKGTDPRANTYNLTITIDNNGLPVVWYPGKPDPQNLKGTTRTLDKCNGESKRAKLEDGIISRSGWAVIDDSFSAKRADGSRSYAFEPNDTIGYDWLTVRSDPNAMDLYFLGYGHDYKKALYDFTRVAGKIPLPPAFIFGYWYSKYQSYTADDFRQLANEIRGNGIPADVMIIDMDWHWNGKEESQSKDRGGWTGWSWNTNLIPDPKGLIKDLHNKGFRTALNLHPAMGISQSESPQYFDAMHKALNGKYENTDDKGTRINWVLDSVDFAQSFFDTVIRDHEAEGVDFWWLDWQQWRTSKYTPDLGQTFWCNHMFFNDMKKNRPDRRPLIYHRWGGLGSHRYQVGFSGDTYINFPTLAFEPYFTATASNVGYGYWGHDLGGHMIKEDDVINDPELLLRWVQFGVFSPIFRTHATKNPRIERRMWKFSNFNDLLDAVKLRYRLFPYIYTMARKSYDTGVSIVRPMYYDNPEDDEAYAFEGQYMFGDDILVAPITEPSTDSISTKSIWFPQGQWWDMAHNKLIEGPAVLSLDYSLTEIPYFIRQGAILPLYPDGVQSVVDTPDSMTIAVVAGADGESVLYEDQGDNTDYDEVYATTRMTLKGNSLIIHPRQGNVTGLKKEQSYTVEVFNAAAPVSVVVNGKKTKNYVYDATRQCLTIQVPRTSCDKQIVLTID